VAASVSEWQRIHSLTLAATTRPDRSERWNIGTTVAADDQLRFVILNEVKDPA
jgi:hypothetical protein